jgi:hypothetical protein
MRSGAFSVTALFVLVTSLAVFDAAPTVSATRHPTVAIRSSASVPVRLGKQAQVGAGWALRVDLASPATWVVGGQVMTIDAGSEEFLLQVTATWSGSGKGDVRSLLRRMWLHGAHSLSSDFYSTQSGGGGIGCALKQTPKRWQDITSVGGGRVATHGSIKGRACFQIDQADRLSLTLRVTSPTCHATPLAVSNCAKYVMFKLR